MKESEQHNSVPVFDFNQGLQSETTKETVPENVPAISRRRVWLPCVPSPKVPVSVKEPSPCVVRHRGISQVTPLLLPKSRISELAAALLTCRLHELPVQYVELTVNVGMAELIIRIRLLPVSAM